MKLAIQRTLTAALAVVTLASLVAPAFAFDRRDRDHHYYRHHPAHYVAPRAYYAPPPVVYAPPPPPSPGINLMFNIR